MRIKRRENEAALSNEEVELRRRRIENIRDYLSGYRVCLDMLDLRKYERRRVRRQEEDCSCEDVFSGDEFYWRSRVSEVTTLVQAMKNSREKVVIYYHYIRGESIEHIADFLGVSRRTGYRLHEKGLLSASFLLDRIRNNQF